MCSLRSRNWSTPITPAFTAARPYWIPTLSSGRRAKPVSGSIPRTFTLLSCSVQRAPSGFVAGLYTSAPIAGQPSVGFTPPTNKRFHMSQVPVLACPLIASFCSVVSARAERRAVVVHEQAAIGDTARDRRCVGERHRCRDRVEEARVVVPDPQLLDRAAGTAVADRELGHAVVLDEVFAASSARPRPTESGCTRSGRCRACSVATA